MKKKTLILWLLVLCFSVFAEKIEFNFDINIDKKGNAKIVYTQKATASQWKNLMAVYGNNPALLKRELIRSLPTYELENFSFKRDDMNRSFVFTFDAKGVVKYLGEGVWEFEYDKKSTAKRITDTKWFFTNSEAENNLVSQYNVTVTLPEEAKDVKTTVNEFGKSVLRYKLKTKSNIPWFLIIGGLVFFAGIVMIILSFTVIKE